MKNPESRLSGLWIVWISPLRSLRSALIDEPLAKLLAIADVWDAPVQATSPKEIADSLAVHVLNAGVLGEIRAGLPTQAQTALETLLGAGGKMPVAGFERRFGVIRAMGPGRLERERPWEVAGQRSGDALVSRVGLSRV